MRSQITDNVNDTVVLMSLIVNFDQATVSHMTTW